MLQFRDPARARGEAARPGTGMRQPAGHVPCWAGAGGSIVAQLFAALCPRPPPRPRSPLHVVIQSSPIKIRTPTSFTETTTYGLYLDGSDAHSPTYSALALRTPRAVTLDEAEFSSYWSRKRDDLDHGHSAHSFLEKEHTKRCQRVR
jgi:hypothetical protein